MTKPKFKIIIILSAIVLVINIFAAFIINRSVALIAQEKHMYNRLTLIIDAGHGGEDGGATSCTGVLESKINLEIAEKLNDLMHLLGFSTKMIRTTDISIYNSGSTLSQKKVSDLKERVRIVNETSSGVLVSIHQNHYPDSRYSGAQVFYAPSAKSKQLAQDIQDAFLQTLNPNSTRNIKKADGIYLMQNITCPGILIECGFLSNPQEEALLRDREFQQRICSVIATAISRSLNKNQMT